MQPRPARLAKRYVNASIVMARHARLLAVFAMLPLLLLDGALAEPQIKPPIRGLVSMGAYRFVGQGGDPVNTLAPLNAKAGIFGGLVIIAIVVLAVGYTPDGGELIYYATPARASGFLVGAALAVAWRPEAWSRPLPRVAPTFRRRRGTL